MSALKSRVKRKQEQMFQRQSVNEFNNRFKKLAKIIADELTCSCRDKITNLSSDTKDQAGSSAAPTSGQHTESTKIGKSDLLYRLVNSMDKKT